MPLQVDITIEFLSVVGGGLIAVLALVWRTVTRMVRLESRVAAHGAILKKYEKRYSEETRALRSFTPALRGFTPVHGVPIEVREEGEGSKRLSER